METAGSSETPVNLYHTFIIILVLQPDSRLDHPSETSPCHSVRCLDFPVVNSTFSTHRHLFLLVCLLSICPACISCGFLTRVVLQTGGSELCIYVPRDRVVQLYPRTLGVHFSHLLWQAWTMLGVFSFPATTWGMYYTIRCHITTVTTVRASSKRSPYLFLHRCNLYWTMREKK